MVSIISFCDIEYKIRNNNEVKKIDKAYIEHVLVDVNRIYEELKIKSSLKITFQNDFQKYTIRTLALLMRGINTTLFDEFIQNCINRIKDIEFQDSLIKLRNSLSQVNISHYDQHIEDIQTYVRGRQYNDSNITTEQYMDVLLHSRPLISAIINNISREHDLRTKIDYVLQNS